MSEEEESYVTGKTRCPNCAKSGGDTSGDNLCVYSDGHSHCFACGHHAGSDGEAGNVKPSEGKGMFKTLIEDAEYRPLLKRKLTEETCKHFGYQVGKYQGKTVQIANYKVGTDIVAQKLRGSGKKFTILGKSKEMSLFGKHLWRDGGAKVVITEGEIDAMSVSQVQGNKWPVVSVPNGASSAAKHVAQELEWLEKFEEVIFMFDMDEPGQKAALECVKLISLGKGYIASLPLKDPNEMLVAGRNKELIDAIWGRKEFRPDGSVTIADIRDQLNKKTEWGLPWCFETLNKATYGRRMGEIIGLGAGTGVGKTDLLTQQVAYDMNTLNEKVGVMFLEQLSCVETVQRIAGKAAEMRFHIPDVVVPEGRLLEEADKIEDKLFMYDSCGMADWDKVEVQIRYWKHSKGIRIVYLDHLTALADPSNAREDLETIMQAMAQLAKELQIIIMFVSHLTTSGSKTKTHEEGARVTIRCFKGSRAIGFWAHFLFGLERNQQADDLEEKKRTTFRVLKDRYTGGSTGLTFGLSYNTDTGMLFEVPLPPKKKKSPFPDQDDGEF